MKTYMKPFTQSDWHAYCGCESPDPYIWVNDTCEIIQDGDLIILIDAGVETHELATGSAMLALGMAEAIVSMLRNELPVWLVVQAMEMKQL